MLILNTSFKKLIIKSFIHRAITNRKIHYDVVIVGGAGMGSSSAYFLKNKSPSLKVAVVERDPTVSLNTNIVMPYYFYFNRLVYAVCMGNQ